MTILRFTIVGGTVPAITWEGSIADVPSAFLGPLGTSADEIERTRATVSSWFAVQDAPGMHLTTIVWAVEIDRVRTRFEQFAVAYRAGLLAAVQANPADYMIPPGRTPQDYAMFVSGRMLASIQSNPGGVNYAGDGFKRACKSLGIKYTRKAMWEFLGVK